MKIAIPTYRRPNKFLTLKLAEQIVGRENVFVFFHDNEDYEAYKQNYDFLNSIVTNNPRGIAKQRNAILKNFPRDEEIIMMDDDITCFYKLTNGKLRKLSPVECKGEFGACFKITRKENCKVWGIYPVDNDYFMSNKIDDETLLIGCTMGIINNELRYDEELNSKEDYDFCLQNIKKFGKSIRFNYLTSKAKHKQTNEKDGGCAWAYKEWDKDCKKLLDKWYPIIKPNPKRENEIVLSKNISLIHVEGKQEKLF